MIDIKDALYIPGIGFSATRTKDQSLGSAEADFAALMKEVQASREKQEAEEAAKGEFIRGTLTAQDIEELAAKYAPDNMTQEEYDSFLDYLIEKGVLEKKDLKYIDYRGDLIPNGQFVCLGSVDLSELEKGGDPFKNCMCISTWTGNSRPSYAAFALDARPDTANVLAWAKEMSLWKSHGASSPLLDAENRRCDIYATLAKALDAIQRKRLSRVPGMNSAGNGNQTLEAEVPMAEK